MRGGEGAEVIYALRNNESLSSKILNNIAKEGQRVRSYFQKRGTNNPNKDYYFILRDTGNLESVIVEYGFLDNANDAYRLKNNYKDYALAVVDAVLDYKNLNNVSNTNGYYVVKSGDTLYSIAKKYNMTVDKLKDINNLSTNKLSIGQKLYINDDGNNSDNIYVVKKGDTLYSIAKKFNTTVNELKNKNNLYSDLIQINQKLNIS